MADSMKVGRSCLVLLVFLVITVAVALPAVASEGGERGDRLEEIALDIEELIGLVRVYYVVEERIEAIEERLRSGLDGGTYRSLTDPVELAARLTADLREASGDQHFGVRPKPEDGERAVDPPEAGEEPDEEHRAAPRVPSSGIGRVEILEGSVGYIEILAFPNPGSGAAAADAAFAEIADTAALILDLRASHGGHPGMVGYLLSYLFDREPFVFNRFFLRSSGETYEFRTRGDLPSPRYADRPVYVLTSSRTPSAAEGFSYHLKHLGRAAIVGERTAGAAHITTAFTLRRLQVAIPTGRPISPVTGTNWEGTGVEPHHEVPAEQALEEALELLAGTGDS